jgi:isopentenyl-diphosphate delta-isomerase
MMSKLIAVDRQDKIIGFEEKRKCHDCEGILHRAFSIFIFNDKRELLIQQRSEFKRLWPLFWSNSCCSHPRLDETILEAAEKRLIKECGISCPLNNLYKFQYSAKYKDKGSENEICSVLIGRLSDEQNIAPNPEEIADYKWININELKKDVKENQSRYTPWFKIESEELFSNYQDKINELFIF